MMNERKIRRITADALGRLGYRDITPATVPDALVTKIILSLCCGQFAVRVDGDLSDTQSTAVIESFLGLIALTDSRASRKRSRDAAQAAQAATL